MPNYHAIAKRAMGNDALWDNLPQCTRDKCAAEAKSAYDEGYKRGAYDGYHNTASVHTPTPTYLKCPVHNMAVPCMGCEHKPKG